MRDPEIARMMENWARWHDGGDLSAASMEPRLEDSGGEVFEGPAVPVLNGEAEDVDEVLRRLTAERRQCLVLAYTWGAGTDDGRARKCACSRMTYHRRLELAHLDFWREYYARRKVESAVAR